MRDVGSKIAKKRQELGLSQGELAKRAGIARSTLSYIEQNKKRPQFDTISAICRVLGITVLELLSYEEQPATRKLFEQTMTAYGMTERAATPQERVAMFERYLYNLYLAQTSS